MRKGKLIVFEGLDGSGKTTQIKMLEEWLKKRNIAIHTTKQPTDFYRNDIRVRDYLDRGIAPNMYSIALLAAADRTYQNEVEIKPLLEKGINIISDRYVYSSLAFFKERGIDYGEIEKINKNIEEPDLVVFLDVLPDNALERVKKRDGKNIKFEERNNTAFINVRKNFLEVLPENKLIIDSKLEIDEIHNKIVDYIEKMEIK